MEESENLGMYLAAVRMAEAESGGSGEANVYDHVAKDLFVEGYDEEYDELTPEMKSWYVREYHEMVMQKARRYRVYKE